MTLGEKILTLRKTRGWSQEDLAGRIGVTRQALSRWESDAAVPDTVNVVQMADLFGVSCDYLLRDGWTEERPDLPAGGKAKERRIVAWVVTALGAAGTLTTLILGCVLPHGWAAASGPFAGLKLDIICWFKAWIEQDLLWLPLLFWVMLAWGILLLHYEKVKKAVTNFFWVLTHDVQEIADKENRK